MRVPKENGLGVHRRLLTLRGLPSALCEGYVQAYALVAGNESTNQTSQTLVSTRSQKPDQLLFSLKLQVRPGIDRNHLS